ncbi:MAG: VanZ family protein [Bacteroidales bacterium]
MRFILYKVLFFIYLAVLFCLMLITINPGKVEIPAQLLGIEIDKLVHFTLFFPYSVFSWLAFGRTTVKRFSNWSFVLIGASGFVLAAVTEFSQLLNPSRNFDPKDMLSNFIAILAGTIVITVIYISKKYFHK